MYITKEDLTERYSEQELTEISNDKAIERAIADACDIAASYLRPVGLANISPAPQALKIKVCDIARYIAHGESTTDLIDNRYNQAIDWLKEVKKTPTMLADADNTPVAVDSGIAVTTDASLISEDDIIIMGLFAPK